MCFSATASFSAGLALLVCGVASIYRARNNNRLKMLADIPLIFGVQQLAEGFVWLSFINPFFEPIRMIASYLFLFCAGVVWPIWIPTAVMKYEQSSKQLFGPLLAGVLFALGFIGYTLMHSINVHVPCSLAYDFNLAPWLHYVASVLYVLATIAPFFMSRNRLLWGIGSMIAGAYLVSYFFYLESFPSVWCFFAAIISIFVYGFVANETRSK